MYICLLVTDKKMSSKKRIYESTSVLMIRNILFKIFIRKKKFGFTLHVNVCYLSLEWSLSTTLQQRVKEKMTHITK